MANVKPRTPPSARRFGPMLDSMPGAVPGRGLGQLENAMGKPAFTGSLRDVQEGLFNHPAFGSLMENMPLLGQAAMDGDPAAIAAASKALQQYPDGIPSGQLDLWGMPSAADNPLLPYGQWSPADLEANGSTMTRPLETADIHSESAAAASPSGLDADVAAAPRSQPGPRGLGGLGWQAPPPPRGPSGLGWDRPIDGPPPPPSRTVPWQLGPAAVGAAAAGVGSQLFPGSDPAEEEPPVTAADIKADGQMGLPIGPLDRNEIDRSIRATVGEAYPKAVQDEFNQYGAPNEAVELGFRHGLPANIQDVNNPATTKTHNYYAARIDQELRMQEAERQRAWDVLAGEQREAAAPFDPYQTPGPYRSEPRVRDPRNGGDYRANLEAEAKARRDQRQADYEAKKAERERTQYEIPHSQGPGGLGGFGMSEGPSGDSMYRTAPGPVDTRGISEEGVDLYDPKEVDAYRKRPIADPSTPEGQAAIAEARAAGFVNDPGRPLPSREDRDMMARGMVATRNADGGFGYSPAVPSEPGDLNGAPGRLGIREDLRRPFRDWNTGEVMPGTNKYEPVPVETPFGTQYAYRPTEGFKQQLAARENDLRRERLYAAAGFPTQMDGDPTNDIRELRAAGREHRARDLAERKNRVAQRGMARAEGMTPLMYQEFNNASPEVRGQIVADNLTPRAVQVTNRGWSVTPEFRPPDRNPTSFEHLVAMSAMNEARRKEEEAALGSLRQSAHGTLIGDPETGDPEELFMWLQGQPGGNPARAEQVTRERFPGWRPGATRPTPPRPVSDGVPGPYSP